MRAVIPIIILFISCVGFAQTDREVCALNIGVEVPSALIRSIDGKKIDVKEVASSQPTIIVFYRGGWCPYCTRHLSELRKAEKHIQDLGYQVIALSTDDVNDIPETIKKEKLGYTLFSDREYNAMKAFGINFIPDKERLPLYSRSMKMKEEYIVVPVPSVFVIKDGVIRYRYVNPNYKSRITSEMLISALKSLN